MLVLPGALVIFEWRQVGRRPFRTARRMERGVSITIGHDGFDREELTRRLEAAGLVDVVVSDCGQILREGTPYSVFIATGRTPGPE